MLRARLFGGLAVEVDGRPVPALASLRARSLLAYLLLHPGPHPRGVLAGRFWPDVLDTSARASLRGALWAVRRALQAVEGDRYLETDRSSVGLADRLPREVDAEEFDRLLQAGDPDALARAADLAAEPLLADILDDWAVQAQDEYRDRLVEVLERLAEQAERDGDLAGAVRWTRQALARDPLREVAHRALVRRLAASGRRDQALAAYRRCAATLAAQLGIAPAAETRALAAGLRAADDVVTAELRSTPRPRSTPCLGRDAELRTVRGLWERARIGQGGVVTVCGGAGLGKTRVVEELGAIARASGGRCAVGAALELAAGPPLAVWTEALRELVRGTPPPRAASGWPAELARICPAVEERWGFAPGPATGSPELDRARLFEAVAEAVAWACRDAPVALVLEDVHLADSASLALLAYVGRRLPELPALAVCTLRPAAPSADLDLVVEGLRRRGAVVGEVRLRPLASGPIAAIVASAAPGLDAALAAEVAGAAEGNPLLAEEAARAAAAGEPPARGLESRVRVSLAQLPISARLLADLASAAARPLGLGEAADLVGPEALADAVDAGASNDLLAVVDDRVRFVHSLVREACYGQVPAARRVWLHARLADCLARRPGRSAAEVAQHLRLAGDPAGASRYLAEAAAEARRLGALDDAAGFLRDATGLADQHPAAEAELWLALADVEAWRGRRSALEEAFERATGLLEAEGEPLPLAEAHAAYGRWLRTGLCFPRDALVAYRQAIEILDRAGEEAPELRAVALAGSAWAEAVAGDPERAGELVAMAEELAEAKDDVVLAAELELARAAAHVRAGRLAEAEGPYERAAVLAERAGRTDLAHVAWANMASTAACRGRFDRALDLAERAGADGRAGATLQAYIHAARAYALSRLGRHDEARDAVGEEAALATRFGGPEQEALADFDCGAIALAAGRTGEAARCLAAALGVDSSAFSRPLARLLLAEALVAEGDPARAEDELDRVPAEPVGPADLPDTLVARMARIEGLVAAARGDHPLAIRRLTEAEAGWRRRLADAPAGDLFAASIADLGRPPVAGLVEPGVELGRVLADRAALLAAGGDDERARQAAREAIHLADALGFDGFRHRLAHLTGIRPESDRHAQL